jgi:hypothetical protein
LGEGLLVNSPPPEHAAKTPVSTPAANMTLELFSRCRSIDAFRTNVAPF